MRVVKREFSSDGSGRVSLTPEDAEDLWVAFGLIQVGDRVRASAVRRVTRGGGGGEDGGGGGGGGGETDRVRTRLTLQVSGLSFDADTGAVRVTGRNVVENDFVRMGAFHTLDLELGHAFDLEKDEWDSVQMERLKEAAHPATAADVAAVVMDTGVANLCLVSDRMTVVRAKIEVPVPKKRPGATGHEKSLARFHDALLTAIVRHVDFSVVKAVVIASPGFAKDDFYAYLREEAVKRDLRVLLDNKERFVLAHASSGHKRALASVFMDPVVLARLKDTRAAAEVGALEAFFKALNTASTKAYYGYRHVRLAADRHAVETLLISDALFRSRDLAVRREYVKLVEDVTSAGGAVRMFSSMHVSGEQLTQMSGIAAMLRYPIDDMEEASAVYSRDPATRSATAMGAAASASGGGGGAGGAGDDSGATGGGHEAAYESDASSDSDASYKRGDGGGSASGGAGSAPPPGGAAAATAAAGRR